MATINLGRVGFVNKGTYSGATAYKVNDVVVYNNGVYACISPTTGNLPTNTTYWKLWLDPSTLVAKTGNETIAGVKTFSSNTIFNGNVGIGTDSPDVKLHIVGGTSSASSLLTSRTLASQYIQPKSSSGYGIAVGSGTGDLPYIQNVAIDGSVSCDLLLQPYGGNVLVTGSGGLGYGPGSGGTVTQLTSKSTAVTLNKPSGRIIMNNAPLASGASVIFPFYNSTYSVDYDQLIVNMYNTVSGYNNYRVENAGGIASGGVMLRLTNISGVSLSEAPSIRFTVIKGATA